MDAAVVSEATLKVDVKLAELEIPFSRNCCESLDLNRSATLVLSSAKLSSMYLIVSSGLEIPPSLVPLEYSEYHCVKLSTALLVPLRIVFNLFIKFFK